MSENKPCPFCGKAVDLNDPDTLYPSGILWREDPEFDGMRSYHRFSERQEGDQMCWQIVCPETAGGCGAEIHADTKVDALAKWNRRV